MSRKKNFTQSRVKNKPAPQFETSTSRGPNLGQGPLRIVNHIQTNGQDYGLPNQKQNYSNFLSIEDPSQSPAFTTNQKHYGRSHDYDPEQEFESVDPQLLKQEITQQIQKQIETAMASVTQNLDTLVNAAVQSKIPKLSTKQLAYSFQMPQMKQDEQMGSSYEPRHTPPQTQFKPPQQSHPLPFQTMQASIQQERYSHVQPVEMSNHQVTPKKIETDEHDTQWKSKITFLEKELGAAFKREQKLEKELLEIKEHIGKEKTGVDQQLQELKKEVEAAPTPQNNKFTSLSEELGDIVKAMNSLVDEQNGTDNEAASQEKLDKQEESKEKKESKDNEANNQETTSKDTKANSNNEKKNIEKTPKNKKKLIIIAVAGLIILGGIGFAVIKFMGGSSSVDPDLMNEYLPGETVQEQSETTSDTGEATSQDQTAETNPEVQGASISLADRRDAAQSDISYSETRWETHKDPKFGLSFDYPINVADVVRTDMSITVLRKTGYIFKVQRIETAQELNDYWTQVKARSLRYKVQDTTFREYPALFLELEDITEYPGDRYLVKRDDMIYDIWYATASKSLSDEDAKRVDIMLNSFKFIELSA